MSPRQHDQHTPHTCPQPSALRARLCACLLVCLLGFGTLAVLGCGASSGDESTSSGGGSGGGGGGNTTGTFTAATAADLQNRSFTFQDGAGPALAALMGIPQRQSFTVQFTNFNGTNTGPMTLTSNGQTASGTVTIGSCAFRVERSSFQAGQGPQFGAQFTINPCESNRDARTLRFVTAGGESATSLPAISLTRPNVAFVLTTDFSTGSYSVIDLVTRNVTRDIRRGGVHSDAIARLFGDRLYVVNRLGADSIQIIDPQQGFTTPTNGELSVGNGSNPQDIAFVSATKAYVSRLASAQLLIINPTTLTRLGEIDLRSLIKANDRDGSPDPAHMLVHNGLVYVVLQHLDFTSGFPIVKAASGEIAVIDPTTDRVRTVIVLNAENPVSEIHFSPTLNRLLVSCVGDFGVNEGGIKAINPTTNTVDAGFVIRESTIGGDITAFGIVSSTKGFAIVSDANFANTLVTFNPTTGQLIRSIVGPLNVFIPHLAINSRNELYLSIADTRTSTPGVRIFDTIRDLELTTAPLSVGVLPPVFTVFIE